MPISRRFPFLGGGGMGDYDFGRRRRGGGLRPFPMEEEPQVPSYPQGELQPDVDLGLPADGGELWAQAKENIMGMLQTPREKTFVGTEENPLTADQIMHNRDLETRLLPSVATARIRAEETGGVKKLAQKEARSQKLSNRLSNIEKQMQTVHAKKDMAGTDRKKALRDLANQHSRTWDILDKHDSDSAAMHSQYNPDTGEPKWFVPEGPGAIKRGAKFLWDKWVGLNEYAQDVIMDKASKGEFETGATPESPFQALQIMDEALRKNETPERAQEIIDKAKAEAPMEEGSDPMEIAEKRLTILENQISGGEERPVGPAPAPVAAKQLAMPEGRKPLSLLEKFQEGLPTNEEYIQGGGMPGMVKRGIFGEQPSDLSKYYAEEEGIGPRPGLLESLTGLDKKVERSLQRR